MMVFTLVTFIFFLGAQRCQCLLVGTLPASIPSVIRGQTIPTAMYQEIREFKKITMGSATVVCQILSLAKRKTKLLET